MNQNDPKVDAWMEELAQVFINKLLLALRDSGIPMIHIQAGVDKLKLRFTQEIARYASPVIAEKDAEIIRLKEENEQLTVTIAAYGQTIADVPQLIRDEVRRILDGAKLEAQDDNT